MRTRWRDPCSSRGAYVGVPDASTCHIKSSAGETPGASLGIAPLCTVAEGRLIQ